MSAASTTVSRPRPVRVTTDLDAELFDGFRDWAHVNRVHQTKVLRALVHLLVEDRDLAAKALAVARSYAEAERSVNGPTPRAGVRR